jgi:hypothetical protein
MHTAFFIDRTQFSLPDWKARGQVVLRPNDPIRACRAGGGVRGRYSYLPRSDPVLPTPANFFRESGWADEMKRPPMALTSDHQLCDHIHSLLSPDLDG